MDDLAKDIEYEFSYLLVLPEGYLPDEENPPILKWVNWRWPRYEYVTSANEKVKACFQFMVHGRVVLQQFTLENTGDEPIKVGPIKIRSTMRPRDLDFLNDSVEDEPRHSLGPDGYGHVSSCILPGHPEACEEDCGVHGVASVMTTFLNGSAVKFNSLGEGTPSCLEEIELGRKNDASGKNKVEIVLARKLVLLPKGACDWRDFIISAKASNINQWLWEEEQLYGKEDDLWTTRSLTSLPMTKTENAKTGIDLNDEVSQGASEQSTALNCPDSDASSGSDVETHKDLGFFIMPTGKSNPAKDWSPKNHLEYFAWRHLEHILSVCAVPLSIPELTKLNQHGEEEIPGRDTAAPVALTCGDMSGHRVTTSASL